MCPNVNEVQTSSGQCICRTGYVRDAVTGRCVCPPNHVEQLQTCTACIPFYGTACVCPKTQLKCVCKPGFIFDQLFKYCCPPNEYFVRGCGCVCKPPLTRNPANQACECPLNEYFVNGKCQCRPPLVRDLASGFCCGKNQYYNKDCKQCLCKPGFVWYAPSRACLCPLNEVQINDACQCATGTVRDPLTGKCCPPNETWKEGKCVCKPGFVRISPSKQCVPDKCPVGLICE